jgi:hypothetical protein
MSIMRKGGTPHVDDAQGKKKKNHVDDAQGGKKPHVDDVQGGKKVFFVLKPMWMMRNGEEKPATPCR